MRKYVLIFFAAFTFHMLQSCEKCKGEFPQLTQEEKEFLPQAIDSIALFKSGSDFDTFKVHIKTDFEFEDGSMYNPLGRKPCPEEMTLIYSYSLVKPVPGSAYPRILFSNRARKRHLNFEKHIASEGHALDSLTFIRNLQSMNLNGKVYNNIDIYSVKSIFSYEQADTVFIDSKKDIIRFHSTNNRYWDRIH